MVREFLVHCFYQTGAQAFLRALIVTLRQARRRAPVTLLSLTPPGS
jgi:hypothetical protein